MRGTVRLWWYSLASLVCVYMRLYTLASLMCSMSGEFVPEVGALHQAEASVTVTAIDDDIFVAPKKLLYRPPLARAVYGGQVIGQALMAAACTVPLQIPIHSFHCYFILGGSPDRDIIYTCKRLRDGKSFFTRLVVARQGGVAIFSLTAQFQVPEPSRGLEYHAPMPSVHPPSDLLDIYEYWQSIQTHPALNKTLREYVEKAQKRPVTIDQRIVHRSFLRNDNRYRDELIPNLWPLMIGNGKPLRYVWMKAHTDLSHASPNIHKCVLAYMSDMSLIPTALEPLHKPRIAMTVSLDHSMWFHSSSSATLRADEWLLFEMSCHVAGGSRALLTAKVWNEQGTLLVTVTQEALIRLIEEAAKLYLSCLLILYQCLPRNVLVVAIRELFCMSQL